MKEILPVRTPQRGGFRTESEKNIMAFIYQATRDEVDRSGDDAINRARTGGGGLVGDAKGRPTTK